MTWKVRRTSEKWVKNALLSSAEGHETVWNRWFRERLPRLIEVANASDFAMYDFQANKTERQKNSPTYKDLEFMEHHTEGLFLEADTYTALVKTIQRDCRVRMLLGAFTEGEALEALLGAQLGTEYSYSQVWL